MSYWFSIITIMSFLVLPSCSPMDVAKAFIPGGGSGVNTAANVQAGKTNSQTVGQTNVTEQKLVRPQARNIEQSTGDTKVRSDQVRDISVNEKDSPWLIWGLVLMAASTAAALVWGWLSPSPNEKKLMVENQDLKNEIEKLGYQHV